jgi:hypothetical protein
VAINTYYWFSIPAWLKTIGLTDTDGLSWVLRGLLLTVTIVWIIRTYVKERPFLQQVMNPEDTRIAVGAARVLRALQLTALAARNQNLQRAFDDDEKRSLSVAVADHIIARLKTQQLTVLH